MISFTLTRAFRNAAAAFAGAAALLGASQAWAAQILSDPSFEGSTDNLNNPDWTLLYDDTGEPFGESAFFSDLSVAAHTGDWGVWFRSFAGTEIQPVDATVQQQVAATAGALYDLSAFFKVETNFTATDLVLSLVFLDGSDNPLSELAVSVLALDPKDSTWREYSVGGIAPLGTASILVRAVMTGGFNPEMNPQSVLIDDFSLIETPSEVPLPASLPLFVFGLAALGAWKRRRRLH